MPPSSSSNDCDAAELDWAPSNEVKLNIVVALMFVCRLPRKHSVDDSLLNIVQMNGWVTWELGESGRSQTTSVERRGKLSRADTERSSFLPPHFTHGFLDTNGNLLD